AVEAGQVDAPRRLRGHGRHEAAPGAQVADAQRGEVGRDDPSQRAEQPQHLLLRGLHALPDRSEQPERPNQFTVARHSHDAALGTAHTQGCVFTGPTRRWTLSASRAAGASRAEARASIRTGRPEEANMAFDEAKLNAPVGKIVDEFGAIASAPLVVLGDRL